MAKPKASKNKAKDVEVNSELVKLKAAAYDAISVIENYQKQLVQINRAIKEIEAKKK